MDVESFESVALPALEATSCQHMCTSSQGEKGGEHGETRGEGGGGGGGEGGGGEEEEGE